MPKKRLLPGLRPGDRERTGRGGKVHPCSRLSASIFGPGGQFAFCDSNFWLLYVRVSNNKQYK